MRKILLVFWIMVLCVAPLYSKAEEAVGENLDPVNQAIESHNKKVNEKYGRIEPQQQIDEWLRKSEERKELLRSLENPDEEMDLLERQLNR